MTQTFRRIIYTSEATGDPASDLLSILAVSRANNGLDGVTGILWSSNRRYVQLLEGPDESVVRAFVRIARDTRHRDIELIRDEQADTREFGDWAMAGVSGEHPDDARERLRRMLTGRAPEITAIFEDAA